MSRKLLHRVAGARPNFMKIAPIARALDKRTDDFDYRIIHIGQHFDREMSDVFFEELGIPQPDHHLECGDGSDAEQTAKIMVAFENVCQSERPDCAIPLSYMDFLNLWKDAALILTDSGGLQEETTALGLPCLTLRQNTERPITCDQGTNTLVSTSPERIVSEAVRILSGRGKPGTSPVVGWRCRFKDCR